MGRRGRGGAPHSADRARSARRLPHLARDRGTPRTAALRRHDARRDVVGAAHHPHGQRLPRARSGRADARGADRRHRRRGLHGDQPELVDRRSAPELPVRLRACMGSEGRAANAAPEEPALHRDHTALLGRLRRGGASIGEQAVRLRQLRQGRPDADHGGRPRVPAGPLPRRGDRVAMRRDEALLARLDEALAGCDAEGEIELSAFAGRIGSTRFADSQVTQSGEVEEVLVQARVAVGGRVGSARVGALDRAALRGAIAQAGEIARVLPNDPDFAGFDDGTVSTPPCVETWDEATAASRAGDRATVLARAFAVTDGARLSAAGIAAVVDGAQAVATRAGARRAYRFTTCKLDLIAASDTASGYAAAYGASAGACDPIEVARTACDRALAGSDPIDLAPGVYDVILEPKAVAEALEWLAVGSLTARPLADGSSVFAGRIGQRVTSDRISLYDDACDPDPASIRAPFDAEGTPKRRVDFIAHGVAGGVVNDRAAARRSGVAPTGHAVPLGDELGWDTCSPQHLHLAPGEDRVEDLLARVERGLWVTRFHYVNGLLDTRRALMTGMTRDGLLLIENGRITRGVRNLRWTEPLLEALGREGGITRQRRAVAAWWSTTSGGGLVCPTLLLRDFHFTGASRG
ncbi:MAG: TldD/PmbA family protein [Myxococcales bacterium]|nr:TldD/PmbA family protein [Myxococcales bacterium]